MVNKLDKLVVLIIGVSFGIGDGIVCKFVKEGWCIVVVVRCQEWFE